MTKKHFSIAAVLLKSFIVLLMVFQSSSSSVGEESLQTSLQQLPPLEDDSRTVRFSQQPTKVGDRVIQRVGVELELETKISQADQLAHQESTSMRRRQERKIEALEVVDGRLRKARVSFPLSRVMSPENEAPKKEIPQVIEGRTYLVTRENDRLLVTDDQGVLPTREEFELVITSLENLGKPNPLAEFLLERTMRVGETLSVPQKLAGEMMGFDQLGTVRTFELTLKEIRSMNSQPCAVFTATVEARGAQNNPLQIRATGEVIIELATCRTLAATLAGPLSLDAQQQNYQYSASGEMLVAIRSEYGPENR